METPDFPEYCVYKTRAEFAGTDVFEFFPGDFADEVKWWNKGSVFVRQEGLDPFINMISRAAPDFDEYGETRMAPAQLRKLLVMLDEAFSAIAVVRTSDGLRAVFENEVDVNDENFERRKKQLLLMAADLAAVAESAERKGLPMWILGL